MAGLGTKLSYGGQGRGQGYLSPSRGHSGWWKAVVEPTHCMCTRPHPLLSAHLTALESRCSQMPPGGG
jgi:hypothetical protein